MENPQRFPFSVAKLYPVALAEGEGMGTAYEYSVKLKMLRRVVAKVGAPTRMFIGGLPEAYGIDLCLGVLGAFCGCRTVVADDRQPLLDAFHQALASPTMSDFVELDLFEMRRLEALSQPCAADEEPYDLWVSTTALQRLDAEEQVTYLTQVREKSRHAVIMAPNKSNKAHLTISGLDGIFLSDLVATCEQAGLTVIGTGYQDVPPFPPGIKRSEEAKAKASESKIERFMMHVLEGWVRGERLLPAFIKRRHGHMAYVVVQS